MKHLTIAIDFDNTWTASPALFMRLFEIITNYDHTVIIATGRTESSPDINRIIHKSIPIVYCGKELKDIACKKAGYNVDIWIDDMPETIRQPLIDNLD